MYSLSVKSDALDELDCAASVAMKHHEGVVAYTGIHSPATVMLPMYEADDSQCSRRAMRCQLRQAVSRRRPDPMKKHHRRQDVQQNCQRTSNAPTSEGGSAHLVSSKVHRQDQSAAESLARKRQPPSLRRSACRPAARRARQSKRSSQPRK